MKTKERVVVEKLLRMQFDVWLKIEKFEALGVDISNIETSGLLDTALDLIGFPRDNSAEFDMCGDKPHKRRDMENFFCRDYLEWPIHEDFQKYKTAVSFSELADKLYAEYEAYETGK